MLGAQVTVALDDDLAGAAPIHRGQLHRIGQIGSLVRMPQGLVDLIGQVSLIGISELAGPSEPTDVVQTGERWLQVQLLGEVNTATQKFQRGVGTYPGLDDAVHFATAEALTTVFPPAGKEHLRVGHLAAGEAVPICLDVGRLVVRHAAIVGSTGAGKTSAVATILQGLARNGWPAANIVVIDPHGEYKKALGEDADVHSVLASGGERLQVPYWTLPADDILDVFGGASAGPTTRKNFGALVARERQKFAESATWLNLEPSAVTPDTPIPFDLRKVWFDLDYENNETRDETSDPSTVREVSKGDASKLEPARFTPYAGGGAKPNRGPLYGTHGSIPEHLRLGLKDPRLQFFLEPAAKTTGDDPLVGIIASWLGGKKPVSVLDFSGVADHPTELAIGVILKHLFDAAIHTPPNGIGIGRPRPVLVVLEEAHQYLGDSATRMAKESANRIAREGRKYGMGLFLVTQRPSELPDTALAQCGSLISLRLSNSGDQSKIRSALPDSVVGLASVLPALRTGEALITGEALVLPARVKIDLPNPLPLAEDPSLASWRANPTVPDVSHAINEWREAYN